MRACESGLWHEPEPEQMQDTAIQTNTAPTLKKLLPKINDPQWD